MQRNGANSWRGALTLLPRLGAINYTSTFVRAAPRREVAGCEGSKYIRVCMRRACNKRTQCQCQAQVHTGCISLKLKINMPELVFLTSDREKRQYKATRNLYYIPPEQKVTELKRQSNKIEISRASK